MMNGGEQGTFLVKSGLAQMSKGGLIMDVVNAEQAKIAEEAGACAVMALERYILHKDHTLARRLGVDVVSLDFPGRG